MKTTAIALIIQLCCIFSIQAQSESITGYWLTEKGDSQIRIFKATNGKYYGKIVWLKDNKELKDSNNPDPALREKAVMDMMIMRNLNWEQENNEWIDGTIYDPENGKTYSCYLWFDDDKSKLKIKGYVLGMRFLGRETVWTRESTNRL